MECRCGHAGHAARQFQGEYDGGELGRLVGTLTVIAAAGTAEIVEIQPPKAVKLADSVDDPPSVRGLGKSVEQKICQQKRSEVVDLETHLVTVDGYLARREQSPGVVGQNVDPRVASEQFFGQAPHIVQTTEIHQVRLSADFGGDSGSPLRRSADHGDGRPQLPEATGCCGTDS
jgi:hypothetical protein